MSYSVNNIKISLTFEGEFRESVLRQYAKTSPFVTKKCGNFFVVREKFVFIIFYKGHVNCTKLKDMDDITQVRAFLKTQLPTLELKACSIIDNITASGRIRGTELNLFRFSTYLSQDGRPHHYNPTCFPGLSTRIGRVTFILFRSGKYIAIGAKSLQQLNHCVLDLHLLLSTYDEWRTVLSSAV